MDRLILTLEKLNRIHADPYRADVFIATKPETLAFGIQIAKQLRDAGLRVESDLMDRNFKTVSKFLNAIKIPFMIFLGPKEMESGKITLKNFLTEEQFEDLAVDDVVSIVKQLQ